MMLITISVSRSFKVVIQRCNKNVRDVLCALDLWIKYPMICFNIVFLKELTAKIQTGGGKYANIR